MPQIQGNYAPAGSSQYNSSAAEETRLVRTGPGLIFALLITNSNASTRFVYVFDSLTATGTPIVPPIPIASGAQVTLAHPFALPFTTGLFIASSSTNATYTASATSDLRMSVLFK